jgi:hypothetical protein
MTPNHTGLAQAGLPRSSHRTLFECLDRPSATPSQWKGKGGYAHPFVACRPSLRRLCWPVNAVKDNCRGWLRRVPEGSHPVVARSQSRWCESSLPDLLGRQREEKGGYRFLDLPEASRIGSNIQNLVEHGIWHLQIHCLSPDSGDHLTVRPKRPWNRSTRQHLGRIKGC